MHNLSCVNTESVTVTVLQHFLVNSQTIIKLWYFHMKFNTHIVEILYNNLQQTFYPWLS